ncbi:MAG TPA: hypothetical protein VFU15_01750 [Bacteroidia bacterium]|nr:hypothetical protein [Bacteroidia bacterium]
MKNVFFPLFILFGVIASGFVVVKTDKNEKKFTEDLIPDSAVFSSTGRNTYFILEPGYRLVLKGMDGKDSSTLIITVLNETKKVGGIETRVVEENESVNGRTIEISRNFFACCKNNNSIYYFGEETDLFDKDGNKIPGKDSWLATGNNKPGLQMPGLVLLGARYYQEIAPGIAMDRAEILSTDNAFTTPSGTFKNVLKTEETTPLEPLEKEYKLYAPGIGLIKDEGLVLVQYGFVN